MKRVSFLRCLTIVALSVCLGSGCGGNNGPLLATVTGTVTMNGQPVPRVNVTFIPVGKGSPSVGGTDEKGEYRLLYNQNLAGAQLGLHNVLIENPDPETDDSGIRINSAPVVQVPKKYGQPGVLSAEVYSRPNKVDFALKADFVGQSLDTRIRTK